MSALMNLPVSSSSSVSRFEKVTMDWLAEATSVRQTLITKLIFPSEKLIDQLYPPNEKNDRMRPREATVMLTCPGGVLFARPLKELVAHLMDRKLPSFVLIARSIKVLALSVFRWHLCDHVVLPTYQGFVHSMNGKVVTSCLPEFEKEYPYMFESGLLMRFVGKYWYAYDPNGHHKTIDIGLPGGRFVRAPIFTDYQEINAQKVHDYYRNFYGVFLTDKTHETNTIYDLLHSKELKVVKG